MPKKIPPGSSGTSLATESEALASAVASPVLAVQGGTPSWSSFLRFDRTTKMMMTMITMAPRMPNTEPRITPRFELDLVSEFPSTGVGVGVGVGVGAGGWGGGSSMYKANEPDVHIGTVRTPLALSQVCEPGKVGVGVGVVVVELPDEAGVSRVSFAPHTNVVL